MKYAIGIDIGGTNTVYGIVSDNGNCIAEGNIKTDNFDDVNEFVKVLVSEIRLLLEKHNAGNSISGIGVGAPNGNYYKGTIEYAPNLKWRGVINFTEMIKEHFKMPVVLTNDANAAAIGEMVFGAAKSMKDFIVITLGTGLGSGFVSNGHLIYGNDGFAGELGHTIVKDDGRLCGCGRYGCLETYASATGIVKTVREMLEKSRTDSLLREMNTDEITSKNIYEAAKEGDRLALESFDFTGKILGKALANTVAITSPEAIILFGGLALAGDFIFKPTKIYMEEYMLKIFKNKVRLIPSQIVGKNAAVLGAAAMVFGG